MPLFYSVVRLNPLAHPFGSSAGCLAHLWAPSPGYYPQHHWTASKNTNTWPHGGQLNQPLWPRALTSASFKAPSMTLGLTPDLRAYHIFQLFETLTLALVRHQESCEDPQANRLSSNPFGVADGVLIHFDSRHKKYPC